VESLAGTRVIIDAGTGLRRLGKQLAKGDFAEGKGEAHILINPRKPAKKEGSCRW
jgi:hypothetical protein